MVPIIIGGAAFLPTLYKIFGWNSDNKYKIIGNAHIKNGEIVLLFNTADAFVSNGRKAVYPSKWSTNFGDKYYKSLRELDSIIDRLKHLGEHSGASSIRIKLNDEYVYTPEASVDYSALLEFLISQRNKLEEKIKDTEKEFAEL